MNQKSLSAAEHRAFAILDAYGSWPSAWPVEERQLTLDCIAHSTALQQYQAQIEGLDLHIRAALTDELPTTAEVNTLQQRILASLPAQGTARKSTLSSIRRRLLDWLRTPRYVMALASAAFLILLLVMHRSALISPIQTDDASFAAWSWYDITGQELPAKQAAPVLTMTDFVNMEISEDGG